MVFILARHLHACLDLARFHTRCQFPFWQGVTLLAVRNGIERQGVEMLKGFYHFANRVIATLHTDTPSI